jgi:Predicted acetyltransferases and hydrolases with the alpha/beta hydrolase fold
MSSPAKKDVHLFVFVHGLWGGPNHMQTIETSVKELLSEVSDEEIVTLKPSSFRFWKTYDGIRMNAQKVIAEIFYEIETLKKSNLNVTKFSIVGYSLGGLISRYLIGLLEEMGFFKHVQPIFFTTFATPHVGVEFFKKNIFDATANLLGKYVFGMTGQELFLSDSECMLREMADPSKCFYRGLQRFQKHILLANVKNDRTVAFFTSYITEYSPYENWETIRIKYLKNLPEVGIGKTRVRPKFVDLTRSCVLSQEDATTFLGNVQEETTWLRSNKVIKVLVVVGFAMVVIPLWFPIALSTSLFVSVYSIFKIKLISPPKVNRHWIRVRDSVFGTLPVDTEDAQMGEHNRSERIKLSKQESFKGDTSKLTQKVVDNMMYAEERLSGHNASVQEEDPQDPQDDKDSHDLSDELGFFGKNKEVKIDLQDNDNVIKEHTDILTTSDYLKFPLFDPKHKLSMNEDKKYIIENLNKLEWVKIPVYLDCWNAHDAIVSRRGSKTGAATILLWCSVLRNHIRESSTKAATS